MVADDIRYTTGMLPAGRRGEMMKCRFTTFIVPATAVTLAAIFGFAGCRSEGPGTPVGQPTLAGTSWRLESLGRTGELVPALTTTEVTLDFTEDGRASGSAGCNRYFGQYSSDETGVLSVSGLGSTKMFCHEPGVMQQEQDYLNALGAASRYEVRDSQLHITGDDTELVFTPT
ncbi:MAG: META domain-containing protein [Dehalococcoidia bacterium]|nr:META domain-containing protein [Dehalococcoidia bacterium]